MENEMKRLSVFLALVFFFALANCDGGGDGDDEKGGDTSSQQGDDDTGQKDPPKDLCGGLCVDGQYCWNGVCVNGCLSDGDCAENQYCVEDDFFDQGHCSKKEATGCTSDSDCEGSQVCKVGACVVETPESPGCGWKPDMTDGCSSVEVCLDEKEEGGGGTCYAMPACGEDGSCPTDVSGGVCNVKDGGAKIIPSKGHICLMGVCLGNDDCPTNMECMKAFGDLGGCVPEGMMEGCLEDEDCEDDEVCEGAMGDFPGTCVPDFEW